VIINVDRVFDTKSNYFELGKFPQLKNQHFTVKNSQIRVGKIFPTVKTNFPVEIIHHRTKTGWGNHVPFSIILILLNQRLICMVHGKNSNAILTMVLHFYTNKKFVHNFFCPCAHAHKNF